MPKTDQVQAPDMDDSDVISGGPGVDTPDQSTSDERDGRVVKINGVEYTVDADLAAALEERESSFQRKLNENSDELGRLRRQYTQPHPPQQSNQPAKDEYDGLDVLLFENPKEAIKRVEQQIINKVATAYTAKRGEEEFWTSFYRENPDLQDAEVLAQSVLNAKLNEWAHLPVSEARQKLAKAVKDEIAKLVAKQNAGTRNPNRTHVEGSTNSAPRQSKPAAPATPRTLGQILAARKEAKRTGGKATA